MNSVGQRRITLSESPDESGEDPGGIAWLRRYELTWPIVFGLSGISSAHIERPPDDRDVILDGPLKSGSLSSGLRLDVDDPTIETMPYPA